MRDYMFDFYPESSFGGFTDLDGTIIFYTRVNALLEHGSVIVDFGCGRGAHSEDPVPYRRKLRCLKGKGGHVIGIDVDPTGQENATLDEFRRLVPGQPWPIDSGAANIIICDSVVEHLPDPTAFFDEAQRVLRTDGVLCIRTPNVNSYVGLVSRLTPNRMHAGMLSRAQRGRKHQDVFPTLYRCNTVGAIRRQLRRCGFSHAAVYTYEAEPSYLHFSRAAYALGVLHQRFAPRWLKPAVFVFARR